MSCVQVTACKPDFNVSRNKSSALCIAPVNAFQLPRGTPYHITRLPKRSLRLTTSASRIHHCSPVCLFGGKGKSANDNEASPWKSLEKAMGSLKKEQSLEDVLRQQMEKQEYFDDGGSGGKRPGGGGGGDGSGGSEDESLSGILDEVLQVFLATAGVIFLYFYIIAGDEITVFAKDVLKFLFTRQPSNRLSRIFEMCGRLYQRLNIKYETDPYWLEKEIISTPTWFDSTTKYKRILRAYLAASRSSD